MYLNPLNIHGDPVLATYVASKVHHECWAQEKWFGQFCVPFIATLDSFLFGTVGCCPQVAFSSLFWPRCVSLHPCKNCWQCAPCDFCFPGTLSVCRQRNGNVRWALWPSTEQLPVWGQWWVPAPQRWAPCISLFHPFEKKKDGKELKTFPSLWGGHHSF